MKNNLIKINNNSVEFKKENGKIYVSSREVAHTFEKRHADVLEKIKTALVHVGKEFSERNFPLAEYIDEQGKKRPEYLLTKDGFIFAVMGFTGAKAAKWKIDFINAFNKLEQVVKETKQLEKPKSQTAKIQTAKLLMQLANKYKDNKEYSQILDSYAVKELTGQELLPLLAVEEKYYTATDIAYELGVSSNYIGRLSNIHKLKTDKYGKWFIDKAKYCDKQVETFKYNQTGYEKIKSLVISQAA